METKEIKNESRLTAAAHAFFEVAKTECTKDNKNSAIIISDSAEDGVMVIGLNGRGIDIIPVICAAMNSDDRIKKIIMQAAKTYALTEMLNTLGISKDDTCKDVDNDDTENEE